MADPCVSGTAAEGDAVARMALALFAGAGFAGAGFAGAGAVAVTAGLADVARLGGVDKGIGILAGFAGLPTVDGVIPRGVPEVPKGGGRADAYTTAAAATEAATVAARGLTRRETEPPPGSLCRCPGLSVRRSGVLRCLPWALFTGTVRAPGGVHGSGSGRRSDIQSTTAASLASTLTTPLPTLVTP